MISNVVAFGMIGMAAAAYAPPAYEAASSSAPVAPVYGASSSAPVAPVYGASSAAPTAPVYAAPSSAVETAPVYHAPSSTEAATYITCSGATTITWYSTTIPVPHATVITLTHPAPAATTPAPAPVYTHPATPVGDECAAKCNMEYDACRVAPDANMSFCASKYATCVGYNPFTEGPFMTATACSSSSTAPVAPVETAPAAPVYTHPAAAATTPVAPASPPAYTPVSPVQAPPSYPASNATRPAPTGAIPTGPATYTGAGAKVAVGAFAGLAGVLAFFL